MDLSEIVAYVAKSGVFAVMFFLLLVFVLRDGRSRETRYQEVIKGLSKSLGIVEEIKYDVKEVKRLMRIKGVVYER